MMKPLFTLALLFLLVPVAHAQQSSGEYTMYVAGKPALTEKYAVEVQPDGRIKAQAELDKAGNPAGKLTTILTADYKPATYSLEQNGTTITCQLDGSTAKLNLPGRPEREVATKATAFYTNAYFSPFLFVVRQYDATKGGKQQFFALSPTTGADIALSIEQPAQTDGSPESANTDFYVITLGQKVEIDIWADHSGVPLVLSIPNQSVRIVRTGSEALAESLLKAAAARDGRAAAFTSEEVTFKNGDVQLAGTLTVPKSGKAPFPAFVLITGSGPQDRDDNPAGFSLFKFIAEKLTASGIAVLRHDDRGVGKSSAPTAPTTYQDLINDTRAAIEYLRTRKEIDPARIGLIGHSEGAETAGILAERDPKIASIAILAGTSRPFDFTLIEQVLYTEAQKRSIDPGDLSQVSDEAKGFIKLFEEAKAGKPDRSVTDYYEYARQHFAHDPLETIKKVRCPILILQGERDDNVLSYQAVALALAATQSGNSHVRLRIFRNLEHSFVVPQDDKSATVEQHTRVSEEVLNTLVRWAVTVFGVGPGPGPGAESQAH